MKVEKAIENLEIIILVEETKHSMRDADGELEHGETKMHLEQVESLKMGIAALEKQIPRQFTLDELRQMDGQPVYIVYPNEPEENGWDIMFQEKTSPAGTKLMEFAITEEEIDTYGVLWACYDRPPGGDVNG